MRKQASRTVSSSDFESTFGEVASCVDDESDATETSQCSTKLDSRVPGAEAILSSPCDQREGSLDPLAAGLSCSVVTIAACGAITPATDSSM